MDLTLTTPALLFPAISLLLLAYTNRFLGLANLIRNLKSQYAQNPSPNLLGQISNLRKRIIQIRNMQACAIMGLLICVFSMWAIYNSFTIIAGYAFALSLLLLMISLLISLRETQISVHALEIELSDLEHLIKEDNRII